MIMEIGVKTVFPSPFRILTVLSVWQIDFPYGGVLELTQIWRFSGGSDH